MFVPLVALFVRLMEKRTNEYRRKRAIFLTRAGEYPVSKINEISRQWCMNANWRAICVSPVISSHRDIVITRWRCDASCIDIDPIYAIVRTIRKKKKKMKKKKRRKKEKENYVFCLQRGSFSTHYRTLLLMKLFIWSKIEFVEKSGGKGRDVAVCFT